MKWREEYSVGVAQLDADHKQLMAIINRVANAMEDGRSVPWVLQELEEYAQRHFHYEEHHLAANNYADLSDHQKEHQKFIDTLKQLAVTYGMISESDDQLSASVYKFLQDWLSDHILVTDMKYKGIIQN